MYPLVTTHNRTMPYEDLPPRIALFELKSFIEMFLIVQYCPGVLSIVTLDYSELDILMYDKMLTSGCASRYIFIPQNTNHCMCDLEMFSWSHISYILRQTFLCFHEYLCSHHSDPLDFVYLFDLSSKSVRLISVELFLP